ncbi:type II toxin-antitoxin system RelE/ParE family toxin [Xanthobacter autotrophicus]|uniref:type II toxin-antitoxin system RelE/ParE family toxin n=1 Tax=Xanthobacter autotrophicus TaxID=280 RepID=UPI00372AD44F
MRPKLTQRAERDLKDIYRYTAGMFGHRQAESYLRELDAVFELIGDYPAIGRLYEGKTHQFVHGRHIILYRVIDAAVVIGRIFHGAQSRTDGQG